MELKGVELVEVCGFCGVPRFATLRSKPLESNDVTHWGYHLLHTILPLQLDIIENMSLGRRSCYGAFELNECNVNGKHEATVRLLYNQDGVEAS